VAAAFRELHVDFSEHAGDALDALVGDARRVPVDDQDCALHYRRVA
jgi:hypothetical protein